MKKTMPSLTALVFSTQTTLSDLGKHVITVARDLYQEAARQGLMPAAPMQWIYTGADGKPDTVFTLEIALPVMGKLTQPSVFDFRKLPEFTGFATMHQGPWEHLYETYDRLIDEIKSTGQQMSGVCREQYLLIDMEYPAHNVTEVQIGIVQ
ncbi:MAG: GyrI-like domain-containing protein [Chitinophagaceae bacterium]